MVNDDMSSELAKRSNSVSADAKDDFLVGGGDMGDRTRSFDWSRTSLGPIASWPASLKTAVSIVLGCQYPLLIWWGDELLHFYNDGYVPVLGQRHPQALGQPAPQVWSEAWPIVGPQVQAVMERGHSYFNEETLVTMTRNGYQEEVYMTSPSAQSAIIMAGSAASSAPARRRPNVWWTGVASRRCDRLRIGHSR